MRLIGYIVFLFERQYETQVSSFAVTKSDVYFPDYKSSWNKSDILNKGETRRHRWSISFRTEGGFPNIYVELLLGHNIYKYTYIYVCDSIIYICAHICIYTCLHMYTYMCICTNVCIYIIEVDLILGIYVY